MKRVFVILMAAIVLALASTVLAQPNGLANGKDDASQVYGVNENVLGMSYGDWSAAWWQWALTFPIDVNPVFDPTGEYCDSLQGGPMFFLAGSGVGIVTRTCTVPAGKSLFFPLTNWECSTIESGGFHVDNPAQGRVCLAPWADPFQISTLKMTIDGKNVKGLAGFRAQSPYFYFTVPPDNNFLGTTGPTEGYAVSDGWWVAVKPLTPGTHVIHFEAGVDWQNVTYYLTVVQ